MSNLLQNATSYASLKIVPLTPTIGAEIYGIDLRKPFDERTASEVRQALLDWKVIFFRDQLINEEQHLALARIFGTPEQHPLSHKQGYPEILQLYSGAEKPAMENFWHSDVMWRPEPPRGSVLRAVELPRIGGDTLWADMGAAYDGLSDQMKARIEGLSAFYDFAPMLKDRGGIDEAGMAAFRLKYPPATHPLVRTIPETGRKILYITRMPEQSIVGMDAEEAYALIDKLCYTATTPEYQVRFHWEPGSIACWDNRATQHYATSDYFPVVRRMERVTIVGDRPI